MTQTLEEAIRSESSIIGHFQDGVIQFFNCLLILHLFQIIFDQILGLLEKTAEYEAKCLRKAIKVILPVL